MPSNLPRLVTRVPNDVYNKFLTLSDSENRTASNMLANIIIKYINEYEGLNGNVITTEDGSFCNKKLANAVSIAMEKFNITNETLIERTGVSEQSIMDIKSGYLPSFEHATKIMEELNFSVSDIITYTNKSEEFVRLYIAQNYVIELKEAIECAYEYLKEVLNNDWSTEVKLNKINDYIYGLREYAKDEFFDLEYLTGKTITHFPKYFTDKFMDE